MALFHSQTRLHMIIDLVRCLAYQSTAILILQLSVNLGQTYIPKAFNHFSVHILSPVTLFTTTLVAIKTASANSVESDLGC